MLPQTLNSFVPVLLGFDRQSFLYQSAPFLRMCGTATSVSTLLIVVGSPNTRVAAFPLERVHQRRLFAADVGAGAAMQHHLNLAEQLGGVRFCERLLHDLQ